MTSIHFGRFRHAIYLFLTLFLLGGCAGVNSISAPNVLDQGAKWALLPIANHTDTPQAALAAEMLTDHLLRQRGIVDLLRYPPTLTRDTLFEPTEQRVAEEAKKWAREQGVRYGVTGAVEEWRYKVGIDGEPAVGITLQVVDLASNQVVWSASGAHSGWSRQALAAVAQSQIETLIAGLPLIGGKTAAR